MLQYSISRLWQSVIVILVMSFLLYLLIGLMPGDPIEMMLEGNPAITSDMVAQLRALQGLDQPLYYRYWNWLRAGLQGDFGYSSLYYLPVMQVLWSGLLVTLQLMAITVIVSIPLALLLGILASRKPNGWVDNAIGLFAFASISLPNFWFALLLIMLFSVQLGWLPASGTPLLSHEATLWDTLKHMIMPVTVLALIYVGPLLRYVRASMIETLSSDYIRTARSKGLSEAHIIVRHALRNALIPMVTVVALSFGSLFSGSLITEAIFGINGMGKMIYDAISRFDFNLALIGLLLATIVTLLCSLLSDLAYALLDPRITLK